MSRSRSLGQAQSPTSTDVRPISSSRGYPDSSTVRSLTSWMRPSSIAVMVMGTGLDWKTLKNRSSLAFRDSSACLLRVMSSIIPSMKRGRPSASRTKRELIAVQMTRPSLRRVRASNRSRTPVSCRIARQRLRSSASTKIWAPMSVTEATTSPGDS